MFMKDTGLQFSFSVISFSGFSIWVMLPNKMSWEVFPPLFLKEVMFSEMLARVWRNWNFHELLLGI